MMSYAMMPPGNRSTAPRLRPMGYAGLHGAYHNKTNTCSTNSSSTKTNSIVSLSSHAFFVGGLIMPLIGGTSRVIIVG